MKIGINSLINNFFFIHQHYGCFLKLFIAAIEIIFMLESDNISFVRNDVILATLQSVPTILS